VVAAKAAGAAQNQRDVRPTGAAGKGRIAVQLDRQQTDVPIHPPTCGRSEPFARRSLAAPSPNGLGRVANAFEYGDQQAADPGESGFTFI
jgi:hypothetical protein